MYAFHPIEGDEWCEDKICQALFSLSLLPFEALWVGLCFSCRNGLRAVERFALALLCLSFAVTVYRVISGPTLPDRILALDMLVATAIGFIAVIGIKTGYALYVDIAIALGLVGFLATVAFARFILARGPIRGETEEAESVPEGGKVNE